MCVPKEQTQEKKSFVKAENLETDPMDTTYAHIFFKKSFCTSRGIYLSLKIDILGETSILWRGAIQFLAGHLLSHHNTNKFISP